MAFGVPARLGSIDLECRVFLKRHLGIYRSRLIDLDFHLTLRKEIWQLNRTL